MLLILIRFDTLTVPERRRAAGAAREEEVEGAEGAISRHCGAVKGEREWIVVLTSSFEFQFTTRYVGQQLNNHMYTMYHLGYVTL
jgi:hypothetical protein